ncbi:MAG: hypothetical protein ACRD1K_15590, partial [Acidimicrobiales bacterium]
MATTDENVSFFAAEEWLARFVTGPPDDSELLFSDKDGPYYDEEFYSRTPARVAIVEDVETHFSNTPDRNCTCQLS